MTAIGVMTATLKKNEIVTIVTMEKEEKKTDWRCKKCGSNKKSTHKDVCQKCYQRERNRLGKNKNQIRNKERNRKEVRRYGERNKEKVKAKKQAQYKVKIKGECVMCGKERALIRHHPDYSKPLEVILLCKNCHDEEHMRLRDEKIPTAPQGGAPSGEDNIKIKCRFCGGEFDYNYWVECERCKCCNKFLDNPPNIIRKRKAPSGEDVPQIITVEKDDEKVCHLCGKSVIESTEKRHGVKVGVTQIGQGRKLPLLSFCNEKCYGKYRNLKPKEDESLSGKEIDLVGVADVTYCGVYFRREVREAVRDIFEYIKEAKPTKTVTGFGFEKLKLTMKIKKRVGRKLI